MELQRRDENIEANSLALHQPTEGIITNTLSTQESVELSEGVSDMLDERRWKELYEDDTVGQDPADTGLIVERELLSQAWKEFVPDPQDKKNTSVAKIAPSSSTVSMKDLISVVKGVRDLQNERGRAHRYLNKFMDTLGSHSKMLGILPDQSLYGSIFCGVLNTLISASANHRKIIEALSKDLVEIGDVVELCVLQVQIFCTVEMKALIRKLYASVFCFLRKALGWYEEKKKKRLLNSFNENFYEPFSESVEEIRRIGKLIHERGMISNQAETRDMRVMLEKIASDRNASSAEDEYWRPRLQKLEERCDMLLNLSYRREIGAHMADLLYLEATPPMPFSLMFNAAPVGFHGEHRLGQWREDRQSAELDNISVTESVDRLSNQPTGVYTKDQLEQNSRALEEHISPQLDPLDIAQGGQIFAEHQVTYAIREWSNSIRSQILWILGPLERHFPSSISSIPAVLVTAADDASIPTLHLFLDWPSDERSSLFNMIYSLIRQIISLLPEQFQTTADLTSENFARLDAQAGSWETGLAVLSSLLDLAPPLLLIIIDGIDHLDYMSIGSRYVDSLLQLLQRRILSDERSEPRKTVKILFTTAGNCAGLNGLDERGVAIVRMAETQLRHLAKPGLARSEVALW